MVKQDITRLQITVDDFLVVRLGQRRPHPLHNRQDLANGHSPGRHPRNQRTTLHITHHQVQAFIFLTKIIEGHNGRMLQRGNRLRLPLEPFADLWVLGQVFIQHLHRHLPPHPRITRQVNGRHPPARNFGQNFITTNFLGNCHVVLQKEPAFALATSMPRVAVEHKWGLLPGNRIPRLQ